MSNKRNIYLPLLGAFSSGKSSLLNSILGDNLLSTEITPETAVPAEIRGGSKLKLQQVFPNQQIVDISRELFEKADFSELASQGGHLSLIVPGFSNWPNIIAVDLPGWSSGEGDHEKQLDAYLQKLLTDKLDTDIVYAVVVSADEGTLRSYTTDRLRNVELGNSDYLLVMTKTEKRTEDDLQAVRKHLEESIESLMGKAPLAVVLTSAAKKRHIEFATVLDTIQESTVDQKQQVEEVKEKTIAHLTMLKDALRDDLSDDPDDIGRFTASDVYSEFYDRLQSTFSGSPYSMSGSGLMLMLFDVADDYIKGYKNNLDRWVSKPSEELLQLLKLQEFNSESESLLTIITRSDDFKSEVNRVLKERLKSAKPGIFTGSYDFDAQGERIISKLDSKAREVERIAERNACRAAKETIRARMDEVDRLLSII